MIDIVPHGVSGVGSGWISPSYFELRENGEFLGVARTRGDAEIFRAQIEDERRNKRWFVYLGDVCIGEVSAPNEGRANIAARVLYDLNDYVQWYVQQVP